MRLSGLLGGVDVKRRLGGDPEIAAVDYDSRRVAPGGLFVAMRGESVDGNRFIDQAIARGAAAILTDSAAAFDRAASGALSIALAEVAHGRRALAGVSARFFGNPERRLATTGVTGTNGKTTTTYLLEQMLRFDGRTTVLVGTVEYRVAGDVRPAPHTTPESRDLLQIFAEGVKAGASEAVMEVSSHALAQERVWGIPFDVAIFTNLTRDHLDFHGDMGAYLLAKRRLFDGSLGQPPRVAVVNADDPVGVAFAEVAARAGSEIVSYGISSGDFCAEEIAIRLDGMAFRARTPRGRLMVNTRLTGRVNVYNLLAAMAAAEARGVPVGLVTEKAGELRAAPGRLELVDAGQPFAVAVDYAHTDDALRNVLLLAREMVAASGGRVITVFGCGGDRDRSKRPLMGRAAGEGSEVVIVTSDNPRGEDPMRIIEDTLPGLREAEADNPALAWRVEPDRARAIASAIQEARAGDFVLLAGKGHEKTQTIAGVAHPFDDVAEAKRALRSPGWEA
jgi:UDP-N-acetylmuramoyl-L-alanyl-D-glutamate--2,6-diaminopimelate ligase